MMHRAPALLLLILCSILCLARLAFSEPSGRPDPAAPDPPPSMIIPSAPETFLAPAPGPPKPFTGTDRAVCSGYHPETKTWGPVTATLSREGICPPGSAIMGTKMMGGPRTLPPSYLGLDGFCCPLPAGVLLEEHSLVSTSIRCPKDAVVTGIIRGPFIPVPNAGVPGWEFLFRCTRINPAVAVLGAETAGIDFGEYPRFTAALRQWLFRRYFGPPIVLLHWDMMPAAIRYGIGRSTETQWERSGCIGDPVGSLLTGRIGKGCSFLRFREMKILAADGTMTESVLPACRAIDDPLSPAPRCIP